VVVLQASGIEPRKGHKDLLGALAGLRDEPRWIAWIAGAAATGGYAATLAAMARAAGVAPRVRWLGERGDVPLLMAAADVYCQPCVLPESFGIAFVEALYAGVPIVTSALGGALEIVDEACGILTTPGSRSSLTGALDRMIRDEGLRRRASQAGPARARWLCDPSTQVNRLEHIVRAVISPPAPAGTGSRPPGETVA
jgi:glycosyltransferase involved in cell wall biosynthesis